MHETEIAPHVRTRIFVLMSLARSLCTDILIANDSRIGHRDMDCRWLTSVSAAFSNQCQRDERCTATWIRPIRNSYYPELFFYFDSVSFIYFVRRRGILLEVVRVRACVCVCVCVRAQNEQ